MNIIPDKNKRESMFLAVFFWTLLAVFCDKMNDAIFAGLVGTAFTAYVVGRMYVEKGTIPPVSNQQAPKDTNAK